MFSTLNWYVFRSWLTPFLTMFILVNTIFLIQKVTIWLPLLVEHEAPVDLIVMLFVSMMPLDLTMTIPIAYFFALIKLVRDLQSNSEIDAMYAGGRSIINIFAPVFMAAIVLTFVMFALTMELSPAGKVATYNIASKLTSLKSSPSFEPQRFVTDIEGLVFYFDGKNPDGSYVNFMLTDTRGKLSESSTYFAERAVISGIDDGLVVRLYNGSQLTGEKGTVRSTDFLNYDIVIPLEADGKISVVSPDKAPSYMGTKALYKSLSQEKISPQSVAHWHFRLVLALSVLILFFYAIPIALKAKRSKQGAVFLTAILVMWVINQSELLLFKKIEHQVFPWWSLWAAAAAFMMVGMVMFYMVYKRGVMSFRMFKTRAVQGSK